MTARSLMLLFLLPSCKPRLPLSEVPITGGTSAQREAVRAGLLDFERWIGAERVRLAEVRFEDIEGDYGGLWYERRALLLLHEEVFDLQGTLRHELCHALDSAEDLSEGRPLLTALGQPYTDSDVRAGKQAPWREAFAQVCDVGPLAVALAQASTCAADSTDLLQALGYMHQEVWTGQPLPAAQLPGPPLGGFDFASLPLPVESYTVLPTTDPGFLMVTISLAGEGNVTQVQLDAATGEQVPRTLEDMDRSLSPPPGLPTANPGLLKRAGWPTGPGAGVIEYTIPEHPGLVPRLAVHDGLEWRPVAETCVRENGVDFDLFTALDQVWYAWDEDEILRWVSLSD